MKAIHNEEEHRAAILRLDQVWNDESAADEVEVLAILIEDYEKTHHVLPSPEPIEALKAILEWRGLTSKDLEQYIGSRSHVSEVLSGRRQLSKEMIRLLAHGLQIPSDILLGPPQRIRRGRSAQVTRKPKSVKKSPQETPG